MVNAVNPVGVDNNKKSSGIVPAVIAGGATTVATRFLLKDEITPEAVLESDKFELTAKDATAEDKAVATDIGKILEKKSKIDTDVATKAEATFGKDVKEIEFAKVFNTTTEALKTDIDAAKKLTPAIETAVTSATQTLEKAADEAAKATAKKALDEAKAEQATHLEELAEKEAKLALASDKGMVTREAFENFEKANLKKGLLTEIETSLAKIAKEKLPKIPAGWGKSAIIGAVVGAGVLIASKLMGGKNEA